MNPRHTRQLPVSSTSRRKATSTLPDKAWPWLLLAALLFLGSRRIKAAGSAMTDLGRIGPGSLTLEEIWDLPAFSRRE